MKQESYLVSMNTQHGRIFHRISKWIFFWHAHLMWIEYVLTCPKRLPCQKNFQTFPNICEYSNTSTISKCTHGVFKLIIFFLKKMCLKDKGTKKKKEFILITQP